MVGNFDVDVEHQQRIGYLFTPMLVLDLVRFRRVGQQLILAGEGVFYTRSRLIASIELILLGEVKIERESG